MFQFTGYLPHELSIHSSVTSYYRCRVSPFGYLRIFVYVPLPAAFRCLLRPSSVSSAKASTVRPYLLNHISCVFAFQGLLSYCFFLNFTLMNILSSTFVLDLHVFCYSVFKDRRFSSGFALALPKLNRNCPFCTFSLERR